MIDYDPSKLIRALSAPVSAVASLVPWYRRQIMAIAMDDAKRESFVALIEREAKEILAERTRLAEVPAGPLQERLRTEQFSRLIEEYSNRLNVLREAALCPPRGERKTGGETSGEWMDLFWRTAERSVEPWRATYLGMLLARESESPGSVSLRTVFEMGVVERREVNLAAAWLDNCFVIGGLPCLFCSPDRFQSAVVDVHDCDATAGAAADRLRLCDLYSELANRGHVVEKNVAFALPEGHCVIEYGRHAYRVSPVSGEKAIEFRLYVPNGFGASLASLYSPNEVGTGLETLEDWSAIQVERVGPDGNHLLEVERLPPLDRPEAQRRN